MRALVIDDSKLQRRDIQRALCHAGHEVTTADDGESGLRAAHETQPDIIVLDLMLPKISGIDVLRALRRERTTKEVPVIVLTALSDKNKSKLLAEGATEFLEKSEVLSSGTCATLITTMSRLHASRK